MAGIPILIIDDEEAVHEILEKYLAVSHYTVFHAYNGKEGLAMMEAHNPALALLDVQMPVMDGFATLGAIRKRREFDDIPVLMLTSLDRQHLKVKGLELGADDYVTKPFNMSELMARIKAILRRTARVRRMEGMLAGNLADVSLAELLQSFEMGSKTAAVVLKDMDAAIYLEDGKFVHATQGSFTGSDALERIFFMEKGAFSIKFGDLSPDLPRTPRPMMSMLMGVLAAVDELNELMDQVREKAPAVIPMGDLSDFPGLAPAAGRTVPLDDLVVMARGGLKDNLKALVAAIKKGRFRISRPQ